VDTEDDLQPLVCAMFRDAVRTVTLVAAAMKTAEFDAMRLEARAGDGWTTLTELADTLARDHGLPFKTAHAISGRLVSARAAHPDTPLGGLLAEASQELAGKAITYTEGQLAQILSPRHFVAVRGTLGGPAPEETLRAGAASSKALATDEAWAEQAVSSLRCAERVLKDRCARL
jgi:argininosuccinate lyase